jgi:hypothetical protein
MSNIVPLHTPQIHQWLQSRITICMLHKTCSIFCATGWYESNQDCSDMATCAGALQNALLGLAGSSFCSKKLCLAPVTKGSRVLRMNFPSVWATRSMRVDPESICWGVLSQDGPFRGSLYSLLDKTRLLHTKVTLVFCATGWYASNQDCSAIALCAGSQQTALLDL